MPKPSRTTEVGRLLRSLRAERGISALELSHRAKLSVNAVRNVERGLRAPRHETMHKIADALELPAADRERLLHAAIAAGQPESVKAAMPSPAHGVVAFRHLPAALLAVPHKAPEPWPLFADECLGRVTPAVAALLGWVALQTKPPSEAQLKRLRSLAEQHLESDEPDVPPGWELLPPIQPPRRWAAAKAMLSRAWRQPFLETRRATERLVSRIAHWNYIALAGGRLEVTLQPPCAGFTFVNPDVAARCYDAVTSETLWSLTGLASRAPTHYNIDAANAVRLIGWQPPGPRAEDDLDFAATMLGPLGAPIVKEAVGAVGFFLDKTRHHGGDLVARLLLGP